VREASLDGAPLLRPLAWDFPADAAATGDDEVLLGPWLLYAPVLAQGAQGRDIHLPAGRWFELRSGAVRDGPVTFPHTVTLAALPVFVREGALVPRIDPQPWVDHHAAEVLYLDAYPAAAPTSFTLYEDDGATPAWETGAYAETALTLQRTATGAVLAAARTGPFQPPARTVVVRVHRADHGLTGATLDGDELPRRASFDELVRTGNGCWYDPADLSIAVAFADQAQWTLTLVHDPALGDPRPPVPVSFDVTLPAGTPDGPVYVASSVDDWASQTPLQRTAPDKAAGVLAVPRGEWFFFKFTRGDWTTVEKWPQCAEASNRYGFGAAHPVRSETVWAWRDQCP
jgi:alpha-glucosidase